MRANEILNGKAFSVIFGSNIPSNIWSFLVTIKNYNIPLTVSQ